MTQTGEISSQRELFGAHFQRCWHGGRASRKHRLRGFVFFAVTGFFAVCGYLILGDLFWAGPAEEQWHPVELEQSYSLCWDLLWAWNGAAGAGIKSQKGLGWRDLKNLLIPWAGTSPCPTWPGIGFSFMIGSQNRLQLWEVRQEGGP